MKSKLVFSHLPSTDWKNSTILVDIKSNKRSYPGSKNPQRMVSKCIIDWTEFHLIILRFDGGPSPDHKNVHRWFFKKP